MRKKIEAFNLFDEEFDDGQDPREMWGGMPEFVQEKNEPYQKIIFRFTSKEDVEEFGRLINQTLTEKTKSAWHPKLFVGLNSGTRYVDIDAEE